MNSDEENFDSVKTKKKNKESIYEIYFKEQEKYTKIYGEKTILFFEMGKFYDAYCTSKRGYTKLAELEPLLNIQFIRRDENSEKNYRPNQFGIHIVSIKKNIDILVEKGYTIVIFNKKSHEDDDSERVFVAVYTSSTYIPDKEIYETNYLLSVYISEEKQLVGQKLLLSIGLTLIDVSTGQITVHEFYSNKEDEKFGLDELMRIIKSYKPSETIIYFHPKIYDEVVIKNIKLYLEIERFNNIKFYIYFNNKSDDKLNLLTQEIFKINFQNNYLANIYGFNLQFKNNKNNSPLEILGLNNNIYIIISLIICLNFISKHDKLLLKNLSFPEMYFYNKHLILGNNAIEQLNIIDSNNLETYNKKIESLFDVLNKTTTPMGKRFLKENLMNPLSQKYKNIIKKRYNIIENLLKDNLFIDIKKELKNISDIERIHRKIAMGLIVPYDFYRLDIYYHSINNIIKILNDNNLLNKLIDEEIIEKFKKYQKNYQKKFILEEMKNYKNLSDISTSFLKEGIDDDIEKIEKKIKFINEIISNITIYLSNIVSEKIKNNKNLNDIIKFDSNDREGYFFTITKSNENILKKELNIIKKIIIKINDKKIIFNNEDFIFKKLPKSRTKIFISSLDEYTKILDEKIKKLTKLIKIKFFEILNDYYSKYNIILFKISNFISEIDFLVSGAIVANENYYCKPIIISKENISSYIKIKKIRHPIIEKLCSENEFIPNDIDIGNIPLETNMNGILLYGTNSCGKSTLMKAIGISIIMAQIGYYVPAEEFIYEPYMALYARITGNDNIFKGLSSFALEMTELNAILVRTQKQGSNTLIIGDEVCRSTEDISGISLVASTLVTLGENNTTFIFSSHLHELPDTDEVKNLKNIRFFHFKASYDEKNDCLVFDRKLYDGPGPNYYGLNVAKYFIKDKKFINRAEIIKDKILNNNNNINYKISNYNKNLLINKCNICGYSPNKDFHKELETHHINFQKNCTLDGKIIDKKHLLKNELYNLVILCRKCHIKVHKGYITIYGYHDTTKGPILNYKHNLLDFNNKINFLE